MTFSRVLTVLVLSLFVGLLAPDAARAQASSLGSPEAPATVHRTDRSLLIAGVTTLAIGWGANTFGSLFGNTALDTQGAAGSFGLRYTVSLIPVVGPLIFAGYAIDADSETYSYLPIFAIADALVQGLGLGLMIAGLIGFDEPVLEVSEGVSFAPIASSSFAGGALAIEL